MTDEPRITVHHEARHDPAEVAAALDRLGFRLSAMVRDDEAARREALEAYSRTLAGRMGELERAIAELFRPLTDAARRISEALERRAGRR